MPNVELVTIFGGDLPEISPARMGIRVIGGAKVNVRDLAGVLLAMSIVLLHGQGAATLAEEDVKKMFRSSRMLTVQSTGAGEEFVGVVSRAVSERTQVQQVTRAVLGGLVNAPEYTLISMAQSYLEPGGAVVTKQGMKKLGTALGFSKYEIDDRLAEALRGQWEPVRLAWESWKAANAPLVEPLLSACRKSLGEARDTSSAAAFAAIG